MKEGNSLNERLRTYITRQQRVLDGNKRKKFVDINSVRFNTIRVPIERTRQYRLDYINALSRGVSTTPITDRWVRDVGRYATAMNDYDKLADANVFCIQNDFRTSTQTQNQYQETILELGKLYNTRLHEITKDMTKAERDKYFASPQSDHDFILSYFEQEKYQEKELSHDNSDIRKEEPTQEKIVAKQKPTNPEDKNFRYGSHEELMKRVDELRAKEKAKNKLKGIVPKGKGKDDDDWLPGSH